MVLGMQNTDTESPVNLLYSEHIQPVKILSHHKLSLHPIPGGKLHSFFCSITSKPSKCRQAF